MIALAIMAVLINSLVPAARADDESFITLAEEYIDQVVDLTDKNSVVLRASGYDLYECEIAFDFTDGNQTIIAGMDDQCEVFYFIDDYELMSALFQMIVMFDEIEGRLPPGRYLQYTLRFSETEVHHITSDTIKTYYTWLDQKSE